MTDYVAQIVQGENISVYRLPEGHDGFLSSVIKNSKLRIHNCSSAGHDGLPDPVI